MTDPIQQFRAALVERGIVPPDDLLADGVLHRCDVEGKGGRRDAAYVLHMDGIPAGGFENWRDGSGWQNWRADIGSTLTPAEESEHRARMDAAKRQREADKAARHQAAREEAGLIWADATPCTSHPYLTAKGINPHGARIRDDRLVIPMRDTGGILHSVQTIGTDGTKRFLTGGRKHGCYFGIGTPKGVLCIAEGFATGASIHEATGHAVAVAFDAGNLLPVAKALREKFPALRLILCADDDYRTNGNPGITKAKKAAHEVGGVVAVPDFGPNRPGGATDFNDMAKACGIEAVQRAITQAIELGEHHGTR